MPSGAQAIFEQGLKFGLKKKSVKRIQREKGFQEEGVHSTSF